MVKALPDRALIIWRFVYLLNMQQCSQKSLSSINKSMKTILPQLSFKAQGTCWWQWDFIYFFFFPAIDFSPLRLQRCHLSINGETLPQVLPNISSPERIPGIWVSRICHFLWSTRNRSQLWWGHLGQGRCDSDKGQTQQMEKCPAHRCLTPAALHTSKPPTWESAEKPNIHRCVLIQTCGLTWDEQNNMRYFVLKQIISPSIGHNSEIMCQQ